MSWIAVKDKLPTTRPYKTDESPHIHCWCAIKSKTNKYFVEHLAWNPYYKVWDREDEDDISMYNDKVEYWQVLNIPSVEDLYNNN